MTMTTSAHSSNFEDTVVGLCWLRPADLTSSLESFLKICAAVGLRHWFFAQMKRVFSTGVSITHYIQPRRMLFPRHGFCEFLHNRAQGIQGQVL